MTGSELTATGYIQIIVESKNAQQASAELNRLEKSAARTAKSTNNVSKSLLKGIGSIFYLRQAFRGLTRAFKTFSDENRFLEKSIDLTTQAVTDSVLAFLVGESIVKSFGKNLLTLSDNQKRVASSAVATSTAIQSQSQALLSHNESLDLNTIRTLNNTVATTTNIQAKLKQIDAIKRSASALSIQASASKASALAEKNRARIQEEIIAKQKLGARLAKERQSLEVANNKLIEHKNKLLTYEQAREQLLADTKRKTILVGKSRYNLEKLETLIKNRKIKIANQEAIVEQKNAAIEEIRNKIKEKGILISKLKRLAQAKENLATELETKAKQKATIATEALAKVKQKEIATTTASATAHKLAGASLLSTVSIWAAVGLAIATAIPYIINWRKQMRQAAEESISKLTSIKTHLKNLAQAETPLEELGVIFKMIRDYGEETALVLARLGQGADWTDIINSSEQFREQLEKSLATTNEGRKSLEKYARTITLTESGLDSFAGVEVEVEKNTYDVTSATIDLISKYNELAGVLTRLHQLYKGLDEYYSKKYGPQVTVPSGVGVGEEEKEKDEEDAIARRNRRWEQYYKSIGNYHKAFEYYWANERKELEELGFTEAEILKFREQAWKDYIKNITDAQKNFYNDLKKLEGDYFTSIEVDLKNNIEEWQKNGIAKKDINRRVLAELTSDNKKFFDSLRLENGQVAEETEKQAEERFRREKEILTDLGFTTEEITAFLTKEWEKYYSAIGSLQQKWWDEEYQRRLEERKRQEEAELEEQKRQEEEKLRIVEEAYSEIDDLTLSETQKFNLEIAKRVGELREAGMDEIGIQEYVTARRKDFLDRQTKNLKDAIEERKSLIKQEAESEIGARWNLFTETLKIGKSETEQRIIDLLLQKDEWAKRTKNIQEVNKWFESQINQMKEEQVEREKEWSKEIKQINEELADEIFQLRADETDVALRELEKQANAWIEQGAKREKVEEYINERINQIHADYVDRWIEKEKEKYNQYVDIQDRISQYFLKATGGNKLKEAIISARQDIKGLIDAVMKSEAYSVKEKENIIKKIIQNIPGYIRSSLGEGVVISQKSLGKLIDWAKRYADWLKNLPEQVPEKEMEVEITAKPPEFKKEDIDKIVEKYTPILTSQAEILSQELQHTILERIGSDETIRELQDEIDKIINEAIDYDDIGKIGYDVGKHTGEQFVEGFREGISSIGSLIIGRMGGMAGKIEPPKENILPEKTTEIPFYAPKITTKLPTLPYTTEGFGPPFNGAYVSPYTQDYIFKLGQWMLNKTPPPQGVNWREWLAYNEGTIPLEWRTGGWQKRVKEIEEAIGQDLIDLLPLPTEEEKNIQPQPIMGAPASTPQVIVIMKDFTVKDMSKEEFETHVTETITEALRRINV